MTELKIDQADIKRLHEVNLMIPEFREPHSLEDMQQRLKGRTWYGLVALLDGEPVGFKLGYELEEGVFYSWLGGVLPAARGHGVARNLLLAQEKWVQDRGYQEIRVKSRNRFPAMLQLLLGQHYLIVDTEPDVDPMDTRIWFSKTLTRSG